MAIEDVERRRFAVQFHPESILTAEGERSEGHRQRSPALPHVRVKNRYFEPGTHLG